MSCFAVVVLPALGFKGLGLQCGLCSLGRRAFLDLDLDEV